MDHKTRDMVTIEVRCTRCGHVQQVKGFCYRGRYYFGSGYDFCDVCDGVPLPAGDPEPLDSNND